MKDIPEVGLLNKSCYGRYTTGEITTKEEPQEIHVTCKRCVCFETMMCQFSRVLDTCISTII